MPSTKVTQVSFAGGEICSDMYGRQDDVKYQNGLKRCLNFVCVPQGPVRNRPGFSCVNECKYPERKVRLIPFIFNSEQTCVIELGHYYARFYSDGSIIMKDDESGPYEITTPWSSDDLMTLKYVQQADIITIVSKKYVPKEIRRYGWTDWRIVDINFGAELSAPTNVQAIRKTKAESDANENKYTFKYKVSALNADKSRESAPSDAVSIVANLYATGTTVEISWDAVPGASFYRVYKNVGGLYCYIGDTEDLSIIDDNIAGKADITTRRYDSTFSQAGGKPRAVGYFEQRRIFAGFSDDPQRIIMTRSGTENDLTYSLPTRDDDRISFQVAAREYNPIEHLVPMAHLLVLTSGSEMRISPQNSDAITPKSVSARPQSYTGCSEVQPAIVGSSVVYPASRGGHLFEFAYRQESGGYAGGDICLRATHLFDFKTITDMAYSKSPYPIVWCVSSSGSLLACTYIPDENLDSWSEHTTNGVFESVASVPEGTEDHLYAVVCRTINGHTKRFVERMEDYNFGNLEDAYFVDCGGKYDGTDGSGMTTRVRVPWLAGMTVSILADGAVIPQQVADVNGYIYLDKPAMKVSVGLPYNCDIQTLPATIQMQGNGNGMQKNVHRAFLKVYKSSGIFAGPDFEHLVEHKQRSTEQPGSPPELFSGDIRLQLTPTWQTEGSLCIRQSDPLPLHLLSATFNVSI